MLFLSGVDMIAALKGPEDYQTLKDGFAPIWTEMNDLIFDGLAENKLFILVTYCAHAQVC